MESVVLRIARFESLPQKYYVGFRFKPRLCHPQLADDVSGDQMTCSCRSARREFNAEVCIHFSGIENLDKPAVFVFPSLSVCLECGATGFVIGEIELRKLRGDDSLPNGWGSSQGINN